MVQITPSPPELSSENLTLFHTTDVQLSNISVLAFYGPSVTSNSTLNSSRIQLHIFSAAGYQSYPRLTISPSSPFYFVVQHLPREQQGDEVARGLAFGLLKYFSELPEVVKSSLVTQSASKHLDRPASAATPFGESHAAALAAAMVQVRNFDAVVRALRAAFTPQSISHIDVDLVLPPGTITAIVPPQDLEDVVADDEPDAEPTSYGSYTSLVRLFGEPAFLPTTTFRRASSRRSSLKRTKSFLKSQKVSLRREMAEFVDTEERYVLKMNELVNHIADDFRQKAATRSPDSNSPTAADIEKLFPRSLDRILAMNRAFLQDIVNVMDTTEEEAMQDLEADQADYRSSRYGGTGRARDPTGAVAFAKVLLEWFPKFLQCYQNYIRASQAFPQLISSFLKQQSSFSQRVQQTGEQRLRSAVIEPIQRLPRYSLFIDNIINCLPSTHHALQLMLKARDVVRDICAMDTITDQSQVNNKLRHVVHQWPANLNPRGRLITAVDGAQLSPTQSIDTIPANDSDCMLLLFADVFVVLRKSSHCTLSARGLLAEMDTSSEIRRTASTGIGTIDKIATGLSVLSWHALNEIRFSEAEDGRVLRAMCVQTPKYAKTADRNPNPAITRTYILRAAYEGKVPKLNEEITKARIEGRFSEAERDSQNWCLRSVQLPDGGITIHTAVFEEGLDTLIEGRKEPAPIRIVVDHEKGTKGAPIGHYGVEITANVSFSSTSATAFELEISGLLHEPTREAVDMSTFMASFSRRVVELIKVQYSASNPALTTDVMSYNLEILKALEIHYESDSTRVDDRVYRRPASPVKMFSNLLSNSKESLIGSQSSPRNSRTPLSGVFGSIPSLLPSALPRAGSAASQVLVDSRPCSRDLRNENEPVNQIMRLEETFTVYIAALQARKGNVIGKSVRNRKLVDQLQVNALYNSLIENPYDNRTTSEANFDVLFCAFEKYLNFAWTDQMGVVITYETLQALQERYSRLYINDYAEFIKVVFNDMAPQNRRAFVAIIKLLADLLDGCGNDGDRGALTAAFAELLIPHSNAHDFVNFLDRIVEDADKLFNDVEYDTAPASAESNYGSMSSMLRNNRSPNTGSVTSNTSLRKRFGLDLLLRQNSKNDDGLRPSLWRTLSKNNHTIFATEPTSSSLSKASALGRSHSIDVSRSATSPRRPTCHDRPTVLGAFDENRHISSLVEQTQQLDAISASTPPTDKTTKVSKKKRRSSLSDLTSIMSATKLDSPISSPAPPRRALPIPKKGSVDVKYNSSPRMPSPVKSIMNRTIKYNRDSPGPNTKENSPMPGLKFQMTGSDISTTSRILAPRQFTNGGLSERNLNILPTKEHAPEVKSEASAIADVAPSPLDSPAVPMRYNMTIQPPTRFATSGIPISKGLPKDSHFPGLPSRPRIVSTAAGSRALRLSSPQKLRLQNSQKIRERMKSENAAIDAAETTFIAEVMKLGNDISAATEALPSHDTSSTTVAIEQMAKQAPAQSPDLAKLTRRLEALEASTAITLSTLRATMTNMQHTVDATLVSSESKVLALDQLYKEASAENELLYEKFNNELGRIVRAVRAREVRDAAAAASCKHDNQNVGSKEETAELKAAARKSQGVLATKEEGRVDLVARLQEHGEEIARVRRENGRLRREVVGLRGMVKGLEVGRSGGSGDGLEDNG